MISIPLDERSLLWKCSLLCLLAIAASGCSLATDFDQDDKPCDGYQKCEDGYYCQIRDAEKGTGICVKGTAKSWGPGIPSPAIPSTLFQRREMDQQNPIHSEGAAQALHPCEENACLYLRGHVCDVERQICVPQT